MKNLLTMLSLAVLSATVLFTSCTKEDDPVPPTISYKNATGFISSNTTAKFGDTLNFGVNVASNGTDNLAKFEIFLNGTSVFDSTFNSPSFTFEFYSTKSIADKEVWKFTATDIAGNHRTDSIVITGSFGEIYTFAAATLGAQNNATVPSFVSFTNGTQTLYTQAQAFQHQADIDMFCFYENDPPSHVNLMTLAAPGSNITGIFTGSTSPDNYTTKNVSFFVKTTLTAAMFDAVQNDAVILASFDTENDFKKAKLLTVGDVYCFKLQSGKYGLLKVTAVDGTDAGTLGIVVKLQK